MKTARPVRKIASPADQVAEAAGQQQQAAERDQVGVHDPGQARLGEAEVVLDRRQRHVHDRPVEDDHQHPGAEHVEGEPAPFRDRPLGCLGSPRCRRRCRLGHQKLLVKSLGVRTLADRSAIDYLCRNDYRDECGGSASALLGGRSGEQLVGQLGPEVEHRASVALAADEAASRRTARCWDAPPGVISSLAARSVVECGASRTPSNRARVRRGASAPPRRRRHPPAPRAGRHRGPGRSASFARADR